MPNALLRYEVCEPVDPYGEPRGDVLGLPYASGTIETKMAVYSAGELNARTMTATSVAADPFTIPPSPSGARRVVVRLSASGDRIMLSAARNPAMVDGCGDPAVPEYATGPGPDPTPYIMVEQLFPVLLSLEPGAKIRARAAY